MNRQKIRTAYLNAAKLVELYGSKYLPVFERLHKEMLELNKDQDLMLLAFKLTKSLN